MGNVKRLHQRIVIVTAIFLMAFSAADAQTLRVGLATAQTGGLAPYDAPVMEGFKIAIDEINQKGGINGNIKIELVMRDVRSDVAQTAVAAQELMDAKVDILVTPCDADPSFAASQIAQEAGVPAFSTCASSPTLPLMGGDYMFANFPGDNVQATVSASWAIEQGFKTVYLLYSPDTQYTTMPLYFGDVFTKLGGKIVGKDEYKMSQQNFSSEVAKIKRLNPQPDVIMTSAYEPDFPAFIRQLRAAGIKSQVIGSDGIDSPTTFSLGDAVEGLVFTTAGHALPGNALDKFNQKYEKVYGKKSETVFNAIGYDLAKVIEAAVMKCGSTEGKKIRDAVAELENVQGATGKITYKGTNGMPLRQVALIKVKKGGRELVELKSPDAALVPEARMN
ncbi:ABC transporter substrate-binding protein [Desulfospira joergensenii]|uniref:ABC transporter substrate-binding protein n=1 Tax=Desulfospira joergensenii TaxID=53329 RepID=UPI0003B6BD80|nr:ABC transporter substrate-binding protein [Desulfospira joergensenii]